MGQISETLPLNIDILKKCREQLALSLEDVKARVGSIKSRQTQKDQPITYARQYEKQWLLLKK